jgi:hypothetical protein
MMLLYFIISYSTQKSPVAKSNPTAKSAEAIATAKEEEPEINNFDSPYVSFFGEEISDSDSKNSIMISNSDASEVVVCLVSQEKPNKTIRNQYMPPASTFKMNNIPDGHYFIKVFFGNTWNSKKTFLNGKIKGGFMADIEFKKMNTGKNIFVMQQQKEGSSTSYSSYEITLNPYDPASELMTEEEFFQYE